MRDWIRLVSRDRGLNAGRDEHPRLSGLRLTLRAGRGDYAKINVACLFVDDRSIL